MVERNGKRIAEFNLGQKDEKEILERIGQEMGLSNKVSVKKGNYSELTAGTIEDIQAVIEFMYGEGRVRLKGLKKVKFLK